MAESVAAAGGETGKNVTPRRIKAEDELPAAFRPPRKRTYTVPLVFGVVILMLLASGMVPLQDALFAAFASAYFVLFGKYVYPWPFETPIPPVFPKRRLLKRYILFAAILAIAVPMAYILGSFVKGDQAAMAAAAPHLFLTVCQVLSEMTVETWPTPLSIPVLVIVPVSYNTRRLSTLATWLESEFARTTDDRGWLLFGRGLAVANSAFWTFNLLFVLIAIYIPKAMKLHSDLERSAKGHQA